MRTGEIVLGVAGGLVVYEGSKDSLILLSLITFFFAIEVIRSVWGLFKK